MLPILHKNSKRIELNALFVQASYYCGGDCPACYLKKHVPASSRLQMRTNTYLDLVDALVDKEEIFTNQFTLSVNKETPENDEHNLLNVYTVGVTASYPPAEEIHITVANPQEANIILENLSQKNLDRMCDHGYTLSISTLWPLEDEYSQLRQLKINWNHVAPHMKQLQGDEYKRFKKVLSHADSCYMILAKYPQGATRTLTSHRHEVDMMVNYLEYIDYLREHLTPEEWGKIHLDDCVLSVIQSRKTGFGCSSGVSRFQVWPDGAVSGCPYAWKAQTGPGNTAEEIIKNIKEARDEHPYDFHTCNLRAVYDRAIRQREQSAHHDRMDEAF